MKIYFCGSIRGGREDVDTYQKLISYLQCFGDVLSAHVGDKNITVDGNEGLTDEEIYDRDLKWILESDVVIAECTVPSLGVGAEVTIASYEKKRVLCLFQNNNGRKLSAMVNGNKHPTKAYYNNINEAFLAIDDFISKKRQPLSYRKGDSIDV